MPSNMIDKIKVGIIGAGDIADLHLAVLKAFPSVEVVGITSRTKAKAELLAQKYKIPACYENSEALVADAKPYALMVLVSANQIFTVAKQALEYRLPLFIEKPAGLFPEETNILAGLAEKNNVPTMVGFNRRYYSVFHKGLEIIKQHGQLLGVTVEGHERMWKRSNQLAADIRAHWIFANSCHTIDLLRFFGGEPRQVQAIKSSLHEQNGDQFAAVMELELGAIGQYTAHWYSPGGWRVVLYGDGATVIFQPLEEGYWLDRSFNKQPILPDDIDKTYKPGFFRQMDAFLGLIKTRKTLWPLQDLQNTAKTVNLINQLFKGNRT